MLVMPPSLVLTLDNAGRCWCWCRGEEAALLRSLIDLLCLCAEAWLLLLLVVVVVVVIMMRNESQQRHEWLAQPSPGWSMQPSRGPFSPWLQCRSRCCPLPEYLSKKKCELEQHLDTGSAEIENSVLAATISSCYQ